MSSRPWLRWLVPLAAILAVVVSGLVTGSASADEKLPPRTAEQLLVDLQQVKVDGFSGTVVQTADLGIPALPGGGGDSADLTSLLSGTHTLRVAYAGPDKSRVALLGQLSESSITRNGNDVWAWSSSDNEVTHATVEDGEHSTDSTKDLPADAPKTPQEAAERLLTAVGPTTEISVATDTTVAKRAAYELVLEPKDSKSLISSVRIAIDGVEGVALQVQVFAGGSDRVASIGFTEVDFAVPDDSTFDFSPPKDAKVTQSDPEDHDNADKTDQDAATKGERPTVVGEGWTTVVVAELSAGDLPGADMDRGDENRDEEDRGGEADLRAYLNQLPQVSGGWGTGRLLAGAAFSVVVTDDGRVAAGAVPPELLYDALG